MPDPTKGSPLAGIEQMLRDEAHAMPLTHARRQRFMERADYLATLREVLTEWRASKLAVAHAWVHGTQADKAAARKRFYEAEDALYRLLTPDSPRQAGEEITDG